MRLCVTTPDRVTTLVWGLTITLGLMITGSRPADAQTLEVPTFGVQPGPVSPAEPVGSSDPAAEDPDLQAALDAWWAAKKSEILGGDFDLTFGAAIRVRGENRDPFNYAPANSRGVEDFTLLRTKVHFGLQVNPHLGGLIQLRDSRTWGSEMPNSVLSDSEGVDLHQGFIALTNGQELFGVEKIDGIDTLVRAGRIEFPSLGDQRMFSKLDWSNIGRTFDGAHAAVTTLNVDVHMLAATVVEDPGNSAGRDAHLYVVYVSTAPADSLEFDVYGAWRNFKTDAVTGEDGFVGDLEDQTYGARTAWKAQGFRFAVEGALQRGKSSNDDVKAYGWAAEAGYRAKELPGKPGVTVGYTFASGDGNPTDGDENTFNPIAPFGHAYQGHYDIFAWKNGGDAYIKLIGAVNDKTTLHADLHHFKLDEHEDGWFNAGGVAQRQDVTGTSGRTIGSELDLYLKTTVSERLKVWTGWSHFWRSTYVRKTGGGGSGNFFFFQAELLFGHKA